jgi:uncharacterized MAPEG superfamily protein
MTPELTALTLAALLQCMQFVLVSLAANLEVGTKVTLSPRDGTDLRSMVSPRTGRLIRALDNHFEGLILFTIACVAVTLAGKSGPLTTACAYAYLAARIAYVPAYWYGLVPWRSLIWMAGWGATVLMLIAALI